MMTPTLSLIVLVSLATASVGCEPAAATPDGDPSGAAGLGNNAGSSGAMGTGGGASGMPGGGTGPGAEAGTGGAAGSAGVATGGGGAGGAGGAGSGGLLPLTECSGTPSLDRLTTWTASPTEGVNVPSGDLLVKEGDDYVAKVQFVGTDWHVVPVLIANAFGATADLSASTGITFTYSASSALHVQLRSESHWNGGDQYAADLPATAGRTETLFIAFDPARWKSLFGPPALSLSDTLKEGMGLVFVGNTENTVVFYGLRIDGYVPECP